MMWRMMKSCGEISCIRKLRNTPPSPLTNMAGGKSTYGSPIMSHYTLLRMWLDMKTGLSFWPSLRVESSLFQFQKTELAVYEYHLIIKCAELHVRSCWLFSIKIWHIIWNDRWLISEIFNFRFGIMAGQSPCNILWVHSSTLH